MPTQPSALHHATLQPWPPEITFPASTCLPWPSFKFEYFRRKDGRLCRHVKLQTAESPNAWHFPSFKLLFAVSYYLHTSFKLVSKMLLRGNCIFPGSSFFAGKSLLSSVFTKLPGCNGNFSPNGNRPNCETQAFHHIDTEGTLQQTATTTQPHQSPKRSTQTPTLSHEQQQGPWLLLLCL